MSPPILASHALPGDMCSPGGSSSMCLNKECIERQRGEENMQRQGWWHVPSGAVMSAARRGSQGSSPLCCAERLVGVCAACFICGDRFLALLVMMYTSIMSRNDQQCLRATLSEDSSPFTACPLMLLREAGLLFLLLRPNEAVCR